MNAPRKGCHTGSLGNSKNAGGKAAIHIVSAWATQHKLVMGLVKTAERSNEITAIPERLQALAIEGSLITIDAMVCQKEIAKTIIDKRASYLLAAKVSQLKFF
ncbi:ISAs1 family transposase [Microbulbifer sp. OS29]|uniref:ISAs1 family transposase n=1 Tax=Microbulbifer okhotskensis TaxID=2926617 RepID=A0A9X2J7P1_9GAMM|nr:ISAs1 family transposase [Microbulbifer okhotskensis]MCO1335985.1 ISAs1 family transposase [Microbulbifer okhotskensis]